MPRISKSHTTPYFEKQFKKLSVKLQTIAAHKILLFEDNPYHPGLQTHKLSGHLEGFWSFFINLQYRVLFRFLPDHEVIYYDIDTHDIYR